MVLKTLTKGLYDSLLREKSMQFRYDFALVLTSVNGIIDLALPHGENRGSVNVGGEKRGREREREERSLQAIRSLESSAEIFDPKSKVKLGSSERLSSSTAYNIEPISFGITSN